MKFSHLYPKIKNSSGEMIRTAKLLEIFICNLRETSAEFLVYDTNDGLFPLPKSGKYMVLLFLKPIENNDTTNLFTTIRRWTPDKEKYYRGLVGEDLPIELVEEKQNG